MKLNKTDRLYAGLCKGPLTKNQIATRFGIANPSAHVSYLRKQGLRVNLIEGGNGKVKKYALA